MALGNIYYQNGTFIETIIADNETGVFIVECNNGYVVQLWRVHYPICQGKYESHKVFYDLSSAQMFYQEKKNS